MIIGGTGSVVDHKGHESGHELPFSAAVRAVKVVLSTRLAQQQSFLPDRSSDMAQTIPGE